ncbi:MAG: GGDEF domain-containing protein [Lachnospiraceae bacterium]|nr:GGDEF domain-containing protein [Lachnospiraceae bacterium]
MFLYDLVYRDVKSENESKRVMVALRVMYLTVFFALIAGSAVMGLSVIAGQWFRLGVVIIASVLLLIQTYYVRTVVSLWCYIAFSFVWILVMIPLEGWKAGLQNFFVPMLMLVFFGSYAKISHKFLIATVVLLIRIAFILGMSDIYVLDGFSHLQDKLLQIINVTSVFYSIVYISYYFSRTDKESEGKLVKYNDRLKEAANTDQLTGLFNRRRAEEYMEEVLRDNDGSPISVSIGDIDFFKKINDTYGHDAGDVVLKNMADIMRDTLRSDSFIARWGGEEFLIVFDNCNGDQAFMALERLRRRIMCTSTIVGDNEIQVTMTFGVSEYDFSGNMDVAIKEADERLYRGKGNGRNQVVF